MTLARVIHLPIMVVKAWIPPAFFRERDPDQRLLCRISEAERFLFCDHIQVVSGIFPAHAPHFMFIQPGDQGAVFIIVTAVIQLII